MNNKKVKLMSILMLLVTIGSVMPTNLMASVIDQTIAKSESIENVISEDEEANFNNEEIVKEEANSNNEEIEKIMDVAPGTEYIGSINELFHPWARNFISDEFSSNCNGYQGFDKNKPVTQDMLTSCVKRFFNDKYVFINEDVMKNFDLLLGLEDIYIGEVFEFEDNNMGIFFEKVKNLPNLKYINLNAGLGRYDYNPNLKFNIPYMPYLEKLHLQNFGAVKAGSSYAPSPGFDGTSINKSNLPNLKDLTVHLTPLISYDSIGTLDTLEDLSLSYNHSTLDNIEFLRNLNNLKKINLYNNAISDFSPLENSSATWSANNQRNYYAKENALTYYEGLGKIDMPANIKITNDLILDSASFSGFDPIGGVYDNSNNSVVLENLTSDQLNTYNFWLPEGTSSNGVQTPHRAKAATVDYSYTINGNQISGYFLWEVDIKPGLPPIKKHDVTYESNGGTAVGPENVEVDKLVTRPTNPVKDGNTFAGWYKEAELINEWDFDNDKMPDKPITLYAKWSQNFYQIKFDSNTGIGTMPDVNVNQGDTLALIRPSFTKEGYRFKNWNTKADGTGTSYQIGDLFNPTTVSRMLVKDITLYAQWSVDRFDVSYESNGGTAVNPDIVEFDTLVTKPTNPTKAGHTFVGWYTEAGLINEWDFTTDKMPAKDITLYAKWSVNRTDVPVAPEAGTDNSLESTGMETNLVAMTSIVMMLIMLVATRVFLKRK